MVRFHQPPPLMRVSLGVRREAHNLETGVQVPHPLPKELMRESTKSRLMMEAAMEACYPYNGGVEMFGEEVKIPKENEVCSPCGEPSQAPRGEDVAPLGRPATITIWDEINSELDLQAEDKSYWYQKGWLAGIEHHKRVLAELDKRMD